MSATELTGISTAQELRKRAERYRDLALHVNDERALEIVREMSQALDGRAREIEKDLADLSARRSALAPAMNKGRTQRALNRKSLL